MYNLMLVKVIKNMNLYIQTQLYLFLYHSLSPQVKLILKIKIQL